MKTKMIGLMTAAWLIALTGVGVVPARADESAASNAGEERYSGTITAVDARNMTVKVKRFLFTKSLRVGDHCVVVAGDKKDAGLGNLRPGQRVQVAYKDIEGVAVATRIALQPLVYRGVVDRIDANNTLTVGHGKLSRTFALAPDCKFIIKDGR